jgi:hypothetical protein
MGSEQVPQRDKKPKWFFAVDFRLPVHDLPSDIKVAHSD